MVSMSCHLVNLCNPFEYYFFSFGTKRPMSQIQRLIDAKQTMKLHRRSFDLNPKLIEHEKLF